MRSRKAPGKPKTNHLMFKNISSGRAKNNQTGPQNRGRRGSPKSGVPLNNLLMEGAKSGTHSGVPVLVPIALSQRVFFPVFWDCQNTLRRKTGELGADMHKLPPTVPCCGEGRAAWTNVHFNAQSRQTPWPRGATPYTDAAYLLSGDQMRITTRTLRNKHMLEQTMAAPGGCCNTSA